MKRVAVYLQDRLQGDWTHDSRVAGTLSRIGFDVHAVTRECVVPWDSLPVWEEGSRAAVIRRIARLSPDLLFCEGGAWHLYALPLARRTWVRSPTHSPSRTKDLVQKALLRRVDAVSICNPWDRQHWRSFRLVDLAYPLDTAFWSLPTQRDPAFWTRRGLPVPTGPLILCVGQIVGGKRPVELFDALAPLLRARDGVTLLYAGETFDSGVEKLLRARISTEGLSGRVHLPGLIQPREDLRQLFAWTDIHVLNTVRETQCMALYESLAAGVPTLIPAIPNLTSAFPTLLAHRDAAEIRQNVTTVLDDPAFGQELVGRSRPYLLWADNEAHDRTIERLCEEWFNGKGAEAQPATDVPRESDPAQR